MEGELTLMLAERVTPLVSRNAREKLTKKNLDMIVANDVTQEGAGFDGDTNIVRFLSADGSVEELPEMSKVLVAETLLDRVSVLLPKAY